MCLAGSAVSQNADFHAPSRSFESCANFPNPTFKDQRSITVPHVCNGTEEGKLLFTRKEKLILPREAGLSIKSVPVWTPRRPGSDW